MKYQLALQWSVPFPIQDLDDLIAIEDLLIDALVASGEVDGHDFGSGEVNIFIHTDRPESVFLESRPVLESRGLLPHTRVAYRALDDDLYTVLWPVGLESFSIK